MFDIENMETKEAVGVGFVSCVGIIAREEDYPLNHGNYFFLHTGDGHEYEIANFWFEDFEMVIKRENIKYPIPIKILNERWAIIHDHRIPHNWYYDSISYRAPKEFWPLNKLAERQRDIRCRCFKNHKG